MKKTIMVVDDEEDIREAVKSILESEGYLVVTAVNADEALKKEPSAKPDLILTDIMMPGTPIKKILPKLKSKVAYLSILRTSEAEKENLMRPKNIVDFIQKPFDVEELKRRVDKLVN